MRNIQASVADPDAARGCVSSAPPLTMLVVTARQGMGFFEARYSVVETETNHSPDCPRLISMPILTPGQERKSGRRWLAAIHDALPLRGKWLRRLLIFLAFTPLIAGVLWTAEHPLHFEVSATRDMEIGSRAKLGLSGGSPALGLVAGEVIPNGNLIGFGIGPWDWVIYQHKAYYRSLRRGE